VVWDGTIVSSEGKKERNVIVYERMAGLSRNEECTSMSRPTGSAALHHNAVVVST
jgi:hypothetical protein